MDRSRKLRERRGREGRKILDVAATSDPGVGSGGATDELVGRHHRAPRASNASKTQALDDFLDTPDGAAAAAGTGARAGQPPWPTGHLQESKRKMDDFLANAPAAAPRGKLLDRFLDPEPSTAAAAAAAAAAGASGAGGDELAWSYTNGDSLAELDLAWRKSATYQAWRLSSQFAGSKDEAPAPADAPAPVAAAAAAPSDELAALEEVQADYAYQAWRLEHKFRGRKELLDGVTTEAARPEAAAQQAPWPTDTLRESELKMDDFEARWARAMADALPEATPAAEQQGASEQGSEDDDAAEQARDAAETAQQSESEPAAQEALEEALQESAPSPPPGMGSPCTELPCPDDHDDSGHDHGPGGHGSPNRTRSSSPTSSPTPRQRQRYGVELPEPQEAPLPEFGYPPKPANAPAPPSPSPDMGSPCTELPCPDAHKDPSPPPSPPLPPSPSPEPDADSTGAASANLTERLHQLIHGDAPHGSLATSPSLLVASAGATASQHAEERAEERVFARHRSVAYTEQQQAEQGAEIPEDTDPFYAPAESASLHRHHSHHGWRHGGSPEFELGL